MQASRPPAEAPMPTTGKSSDPRIRSDLGEGGSSARAGSAFAGVGRVFRISNSLSHESHPAHDARIPQASAAPLDRGQRGRAQRR